MAYNKLKEVEIRGRYFPIRVALESWGNEAPFIDLYRGFPVSSGGGYRHEHFKIPSKSVWEAIKRAIDKELLEGLKEGLPLSQKAIERNVKEDLKRLSGNNQSLKTTIRELRKFLKDSRVQIMGDYEKTLSDFKNKLEKSKKESDLQIFLADNPWLLGLEYENCKPQKIVPGGRYDFYLERYDGFADIVEIKTPSDEIFDKRGKMTSKFGKALQQIIEYIDEAIVWRDSKHLTKKLDLNFLKPKGILVIGRRGDKEKLEDLMYYLHGIEVLTYDDVYDRAKTIVGRMKTTK
jgi:hypothetical protein